MPYRSPFPDIAIPRTNLWSLLFENPVVSPENQVPEEKVVIIDPIKKREFTFGQLKHLSQAFAGNLQQQLQWKKGETLAIYSPNCPEYIIALLGGFAAGAAVSPASVGFTVEELTYQLENSGAKALITHSAVLETALEAAKACRISSSKIFIIGDDTSDGESIDSLMQDPGMKSFKLPDFDVKSDIVALPYSSGTTGRPKGVRLSHYNVVSNILCMNVALNDGKINIPSSNDKFISVLPFSHIYGGRTCLQNRRAQANIEAGLVALVLAPIFAGKCQIILPRFDLVAYLELVQKHKCNSGYIVPPILTALAKHPIVDKYDLSSLREVGLMCAAAPLSSTLIDAVYDRLRIPVYQAFGMTEASPCTHLQHISTWSRSKGAVGQLIPNVEARLVGEDGKDAPLGGQGEVWVRGPNIFCGYHNNAEATAECMLDSYYKTGDIARVDPETGDFFITDRIKELVKYKGFQVPPAELEGVLNGHPNIADVAVVGVYDEDQETEVPRAYVVLQAGSRASKKLEDEIVKWLESRVAHYKRLRGGVRFVDEIPKNPSGKILRRILKKQAAEEADKVKAAL